MELERRSAAVELRLVPGEGTKPAVLSGYAAVYDSLSTEMGGGNRRFRERIAPGAFRTALEHGGNVFAFYHHGVSGGGGMGSAMPLGSTQDGSLRLREDGRGLAFELDLPDTTDARDLAELVRRGTVRGVSFAFQSKGVKDTWRQEADGLVRTLHEVPVLLDVSPTHMPAYQDTALAVRSLEVWEAAVVAVRSVNAAGEVSQEQQIEMIELALKQLLGPAWEPKDRGPAWFLVATFSSSCVIRRGPEHFSYPVDWGTGTPVLGKPAKVEEVFRSGSHDLESESRRRRLRLLEIESA